MVRFNPKARLDTSRVRDAGRGGGGGGGFGGGGGGRLPIPGGMAGGGGVVGIIVVVVFVIIQLAGGGGGGVTGGSGLDASRFTDTGRYADCKTGEDANNSADCARVAVENSLFDFWGGELGSKFRPVDSINTFEGSIQTGCGPADSSVGPFYCPADEKIYLDSGFFEQVLEDQLDGPQGQFVEAYVLAHEYGHHISNLIGTMGQVTGGTGPQSDGVRLELQADCFAGMWAQAALKTQDSTGEPLYSEITQDDISKALAAAAAVGDDRIQKKAQGRVTPETFSHGTSEQRQRWFNTGFTEGTLQACDTFGIDRV